MTDFSGALSDLTAGASSGNAEPAPPIATPSRFAGALADLNAVAQQQGQPFGSLTPAAPYGATDALVHGATFGLSGPVSALGTAAGRYLKGQGFDFPEAMREQNAGREAYQAAHPWANFGLNLFGGAGIGGAAAAPATTALGALGRSAATGAAAGGISGAADNAQSPGDAARSGAIGAGLGAGLGLAAPLAAGAVNPSVSPAVGMLRQAGVTPTAGQILGGAANRLEEGAQSIPLIGDFIKGARRAAVVDFNRGAINQALAPIGERLEAEPGTREAIAEMQDKIGRNYDSLTSGLGFPAQSPAAAQLTADLNRIGSLSAFMPPDRAQQLGTIVQKQVLDKMSPGGGMTGESFQEAKSALGGLASNYMNSSSADERQLGGALLETQMALRNALKTANPQVAPQLDAADAAYANSLRVQRAATATGGGEPGLFTPAQLQAASKALDPTLRKRAFAAGGALMQPYAEAGKTVLGNKVPDSGTPFRQMTELALGGLLGHELVPPEYLLGAGGAALAAKLAYSPLGRRLMAGAIMNRPAAAAPIAGAVRGLAPGLAVGGQGLLSSP